MQGLGLRGLVLLAATVGLAGCKSAFVDAHVVNATGEAISLVEVDYPSASFGRETLGAGAQFDYRFKILGNGGTAVSWTDAEKRQHSVKGPELDEGQDGKVWITIGPGDVAAWKVELKRL